MALVATDWTVTRSNGNIRYTGAAHGGASPSYATVIEFHRWLQGLADDAVAAPASSDELDITNTNPSQRSTDNIITLINNYNIDDTASQHLYDGSIIQNGGADIYDGIVNFGNASVQIQIIQNGTVLASDWWNFGGAGLNANATAGISHRFMIKTRSGGADVDGRRLIGTCRRFGFTYSEFSINGTARGNNVLALNDASDLNNSTSIGTVAGWTFTNLVEGYNSMDVNNDTTLEYYYSKWDINTGVNTINHFYEYMKWLSRDGSASTLYGINGELFRGITHEVPYTSLTGTFDDSNPVSWSGASTGTGQIIADNGSTTMWIQILTGTAPSSGVSLSQSVPDAASATAGTVVERTISKPFCGQSTGSAIIGAYGVGINNLDLSATDKVTHLGNVVVFPPNNVTNTVSGLIHNEDRVLVAPYNNVSDVNGDPAIYKAQLVLNTSLTLDNITSVVVTAAIPSDTPASGYIRVVDNNGFERRLHYSGWSGSTFTVDTTDGNEDFLSVPATAPKNVYIAYIDDLAIGTTVSAGSFTTGVTYVIKTVGTTNFTAIGASSNTVGVTFTATGAGSGSGDAYTQSATLAFTSVQNSTRNLVVIVRDGGSTPIKQYIAPWSQTSSNSSTTVIRTGDT